MEVNQDILSEFELAKIINAFEATFKQAKNGNQVAQFILLALTDVLQQSCGMISTHGKSDAEVSSIDVMKFIKIAFDAVSKNIADIVPLPNNNRTYPH
jgi:hypothetical protein